jgi:hypothetical protein
MLAERRSSLNAAMITMNAIAAHRETFGKGIRSAFIRSSQRAVTQSVSCSGRGHDGDLCPRWLARSDPRRQRKVDRCLRAGAMAMGAQVEIQTIPGYLPQRNDKRLGRIFGENVEAIFGPDTFQNSGHRTGSTDMGDLVHLMPVIHP